MFNKQLRMPSYRIMVYVFALSLSVVALAHAQQKTEWYLDTSASLAPMARVDIHGPRFNTHSFAVVFETTRSCEPMFSMFTFGSGGSLGENRAVRTVGPNHVYVITNSIKHTWHAVIADYSNGQEIAMGVTRELWESLLLGPRSIGFSDPSGTHTVPTAGLQSALSAAMNRCLELL